MDGAKRTLGRSVMLVGILVGNSVGADDTAKATPDPDFATVVHTAEMLEDYMHAMTTPHAIDVLEGTVLADRKSTLRQQVLAAMALAPLPERLPLDLHYSESLDHPWCTVQRVAYRLWPDIYTDGLLYLPKTYQEKPSAGILAPYGHWAEGNADPHVQMRCLTLAKMGYPVFSPRLNHYEDLNIGISHQTVITWTTMRALDVLQSLPEVDPERLGSAGASGGGMQTQFLAALDDRLDAATIVGYTSLFADITEPGFEHCGCNHWPGAMRILEMPELAIAAFPTPVQYITMNDWTRDFQWMHYSAIKGMYDKNGYAGRTELYYEPTEHIYNRSKRERTYWWMNRWLRGSTDEWPPEEPDPIQTFPPETLKGLSAPVPIDRGFSALSDLVLARDGYRAPAMASQGEVQQYRKLLLQTVPNLLGTDRIRPGWLSGVEHVSRQSRDGAIVEVVNVPSEAGIRLPTVVLHGEQASHPMAVVVMLSNDGKDALLSEDGEGSARDLARRGNLVVLPDIRFIGALDLSRQTGHNPWSWRRSAIIWGRPFTGMAATDIQRVLDYALARDDADSSNVMVVARQSGAMAAATLFAAILDRRIRAIDCDFVNLSYAERYRVPVPYKHEAPADLPYLPVVPFILRYGDVYQWAALLTDRQVTLRNVHSSAGDKQWIRGVFQIMDRTNALKLDNADGA